MRSPNAMRPSASESRAATPEICEPWNGLSVSRSRLRTMSRWRESSGVSFGSHGSPPALSKSSSRWASRQKSSKSAIVPSRRSPRRRTNGGPCTGMKTIVSPPSSMLRAGLRACSVNVSGASATCSSTKSGSSRTTDPSTCWPASAKCRSASGWSNCTPISETRRIQPRSIVSSASGESGSRRGKRFWNTSAPSEAGGSERRDPVGPLAAHEGGDGEARRRARG